uniref:Transmembrane glycoprotein NMB n=1 Tax=Jaculus jaculus TaxID=51337 RepID=A0A8C5KSR4_JACJA
MGCLCLVLGLLLAASMQLHEAKRYHEVLGDERYPGYMREHSQLRGWSSDENEWNEELYPVWKRGDARWRNSWRGGRVQAVLTSDSPALVGSNITFVVNLVFPRCQKEDANGNIVYEKNCRNDSGLSSDLYVYNWTTWPDDSDWAEDGDLRTGQSRHHVFPDGKPFPHPHGRKKWNFVYVFHTFGQYFQKLGRCSARISISTTNLTLGPQVMEVTIYRRHGRRYIPVAQVKDVYVVTEEIPIFVTMSQKNDRNASDHTFLKDMPIVFDVLIHDPSHFLNKSAISYKWNFGDNTGLVVSNNHTLNHTYVLNGTFNLNLTVQTSVPGPCPPPLPASGDPMEVSKIADGNCRVDRYGYFMATVTIVEGILKISIIQAADVLMPAPWPDSSLMDFTVTCEGAIPTEVCTIISDPTCQIARSMICNPVAVDETCLLSVRRAFNRSGIYCVNFTLGDDTSLALTSTLISVPGKDPVSPLGTVTVALIAVGCLAMFVTVITILLYKKHKEYKPIGKCPRTMVTGRGLSGFLTHAKATLFPGTQEKDPLLKSQPGIL